MDKRVLLATTISMFVVLIWIALFKPQPKAPAKGPAQSHSQPATANPATAKAAAGQPAATQEAGQALKGEEGTPSAGPPSPPKAAQAVKTTFEEKGLYRATFNSQGAAPQSWVLLKPQYKEDNPKQSNKQAAPLDLVRTAPPNLPAEITFPQSSFSVPPDAVYQVQEQGDGVLLYTYENDQVRVTKRFTPEAGTYQVKLDVTVENKTDRPLPHYFQLQMHGWQDPTQKAGGLLSRHVSQTSGLCDVGGKLKSEDLEALLKEGVDELGKVRWIGIGDQYFVLATALKPEGDAQRRCNVFAAPDGSIASILTAEQRTLAPHGKTVYPMTLFFGPKILSQLDAVRVGGVDPGMGSALNYGWKEILTRPMLAVLKAIHTAVPNWGWDIIVLTILLKILTWLPTQSSLKSMRAMAKLKPEMDRIKAKYGNDKQRLNVETMNLYKQHKVNPLGGCLPMLIQFPIYIALYAMLGSAVELYRSPFFGWIRDLTAPDPYYVLPIAAGVLMFVQQKFQPTQIDSQQQKMMMYIMPISFTVFSIFLPAGLSLYILVNTVLTFVQYLLLNRGNPSTPPPAASKPARA